MGDEGGTRARRSPATIDARPRSASTALARAAPRSRGIEALGQRRWRAGLVAPKGPAPALPRPSAYRRAEHLDVEVADLFAQGIAIEAQQGGGADLVAAGGRQGRHQQRALKMLEHAII